MQQQYAGYMNIFEEWCFVVLCCVLICYVNRSDSFVQPVGYYSCQIKSDGSVSFRRSDVDVILIGDIKDIIAM